MNSRIQQISNSANLAYVESLYAAYVKDPSSVDQDWRAYFAALNGDALLVDATQSSPVAPTHGNGAAGNADGALTNARPGVSTLQEQVNELIRAFRSLGHKASS